MSIIVDNLSKIYGTQKAVDSISFEAKSGEIVGFLGPNGAGKSTTMKMLTCYLSPTSGSASVCNYDIVSQADLVRRHIGYLPEHNPLYPEMYVREYLLFVAHLHQLGKNAPLRVAQMIDATGLGNEQNKRIGQLSKGYRQRVGLAQALIHDPQVLILDEPTTGLDPNQLSEIRTLIRHIGREKTLLLSTHIMQEVQALCDRVLIINNGKIVANDTAEQLRQRSAQQMVLLVSLDKAVTNEQWKSIAGVATAQAVEQHGSANSSALSPTYQVTAAPNADPRAAIFRFAVQHNLVLLGLQQQTTDLGEVFKSLTQNSHA